MSGRNNKDRLYQRLVDIAESKGGKLISETYTKAKDKYRFKCASNHEFELTADKITGRGDWCPHCAGRYGDFNSKYKEIIEAQGGKMLSEYVSGKVKIKCSCDKGHLFESLPSNLLAGKFCPQCNRSQGEKAVERYLTDKGYEFETEYTFEGLIGKKLKLPFDFAVFRDRKLICLIEYDGEQHYRPLRHSKDYDKNYKKFLSVVKNDRKKDKYCLDNNIHLIRLGWKDVRSRFHLMSEDVDNILDVELSNLI